MRNPLVNWDVVTDEYASILTMIQQVDPMAVMAGGCLRDRAFGVPVKDIDVFVGPSFTIEKMRSASPLSWTWENQFSAQTIALYREHWGESLIEVVLGFDINAKCDAYPVQIIVMNHEIEMNRLLREIDFGFCQIGYDGRPKVPSLGYPYVATDAFWKDATSNTATLVRSARDMNYERSLKMAERLKEKYPDRTFIIPVEAA